MKNAAYAPSKVVGHWLTRAMHIEEPWLTAFPIDPGYVRLKSICIMRQY